MKLTHLVYLANLPSWASLAHDGGILKLSGLTETASMAREVVGYVARIPKTQCTQMERPPSSDDRRIVNDGKRMGCRVVRDPAIILHVPVST
jgi:hypothetical protein